MDPNPNPSLDGIGQGWHKALCARAREARSAVQKSHIRQA